MFIRLSQTTSISIESRMPYVVLRLARFNLSETFFCFVPSNATSLIHSVTQNGIITELTWVELNEKCSHKITALHTLTFFTGIDFHMSFYIIILHLSSLETFDGMECKLYVEPSNMHHEYNQLRVWVLSQCNILLFQLYNVVYIDGTPLAKLTDHNPKL